MACDLEKKKNEKKKERRRKQKQKTAGGIRSYNSLHESPERDGVMRPHNQVVSFGPEVEYVLPGSTVGNQGLSEQGVWQQTSGKSNPRKLLVLSTDVEKSSSLRSVDAQKKKHDAKMDFCPG
eukprot:SAG31_NODE_58_length_29669_cov_20.244978_26_plen_122_part_00